MVRWTILVKPWVCYWTLQNFDMKQGITCWSIMRNHCLYASYKKLYICPFSLEIQKYYVVKFLKHLFSKKFTLECSHDTPSIQNLSPKLATYQIHPINKDNLQDVTIRSSKTDSQQWLRYSPKSKHENPTTKFPFNTWTIHHGYRPCCSSTRCTHWSLNTHVFFY